MQDRVLSYVLLPPPQVLEQEPSELQDPQLAQPPATEKIHMRLESSPPGHSLSHSQRSSCTLSLSWHCSPPWAASCPTDRTLYKRRMAWTVVCYLEREADQGPQVEEQRVQGCHGDHLQSTGKVVASKAALTRAVLLTTGSLPSGRPQTGGSHRQAPPLCPLQPPATADAAGAPRTPCCPLWQGEG